MSTQDTLPAPAAGHSIFSPSAAARWLACPGSLLPNLEAPDTSGVDAAIGTVAHHIGEGWLRYGHVPKAGWLANHEIHGSSGLTVPVDQEMMDYVQQYVDWVRADYEVASVIAVEQKVSSKSVGYRSSCWEQAGAGLYRLRIVPHPGWTHILFLG